LLKQGKNACDLKAETAAPTLPVLLMDYVEKRKAERKDWSRYGQQQGTIKDLKTAMSAIAYLKENNILTVEKLEDKVTQISDKATSIRTKMKAKESRMKKISNIKAAIENCQRLKPIP
jgi:predicted  nucleic acid-binding Zn-ribbon protein